MCTEQPTKQTIPARCGAHASLKAGQSIRIINTYGTQVVDTWAFSVDDPHEYLSMIHTHTSILSLAPKAGSVLYSNYRRPMLKFQSDSSGGIHDTLVAACDKYRYEQLGVKGYHDSCDDNCQRELKKLGIEYLQTPSPFNLFMNVPWDRDGKLSFGEAKSTEGGSVELEAEMDVIVIMSACPQDIVGPHGGVINDAHFVTD